MTRIEVESLSEGAVETDVVIVGTGPSGYMVANNLARYGVNLIAFDKKPQPVQVGHANGIQPRTQEIFHTLNLMGELEKGAGRLNETSFWTAQDGKLRRTNIEREVSDASRFQYIMTCSQNFTEAAFDNDLRSRGILVKRPYRLDEIYYTEYDKEHPVRVRVQDMASHTTHEFRTKYVIACDGANSQTVKHLGIKTESHSTPEAWVVTDCEVESDFPDIRRRCPIRSAKGAFHLIPTHDQTCRIYVELTADDIVSIEENKQKSLTRYASDLALLEIVKRNMTNVLDPYKIRIGKIEWISEYKVEQKMLTEFSDGRNIFFVGDACHSHSPKAAQGLNTGINDSYNIAWKMALVLKGHANRSLLDSYQVERKQIAADLINFDIEFGKLFTEKKSRDPEEFYRMYKKSKGFTSGIGIQYNPNLLTASTDHEMINMSAPLPITIGKRIHTSEVIRHKDGKIMDLADDFPAFGRFHILVFAGKTIPSGGLDELSSYLLSPDSPLTKFSKPRVAKWQYEPYTYLWPAPNNADKIVDVALMHAENHLELELEQLPKAFQDWHMRVYEDVDGKSHTMYGVDLNRGALVLVRPDRYVSMITDLSGCAEILKFMSSFLIPHGGN